MNRIAVFLLGIILTLGTANAVPVAPTNWDTLLGIGGIVAGPSAPDMFLTPAGASVPSVGSVVGTVFYDSGSGTYTYLNDVTPSIDEMSEVNTSFNVLGFNGIAGWSYGDSAAAGALAPGTGFTIDLGTGGTLDWSVFGLDSSPGNLDGWGTGEGIRFFFQSVNPPVTGSYNLINSEVGRATSFAPGPATDQQVVPEPGAVLLFGTGLLAVGLLRRKRESK